MNNIVLSRIERDSIITTRHRISEVLSEIKNELANHNIDVNIKGYAYNETNEDEKGHWHYTFESSKYFVDLEIIDSKVMNESTDGRARFEVAMEDGQVILEDKDFTAIQFNEYYSVIDFVKSNITRTFKFIHRDN